MAPNPYSGAFSTPSWMTGTHSGGFSASGRQRQNYIDRHFNNPRIRAANDASAAARTGGAPGGINAGDERRSAFDLTSGRAQDILDDPRIEAAMRAYQQVLSGEGLPYSDDVVGMMEGRAADQAGAAYGAREQMARRRQAARGGSVNDASFQQTQQQALSDKQRQVQGSNREIALQAALQNFNAQQQAAASLAGTRMGQYTAGNPLASQAADYHVQSYDQPYVPPISGGGVAATAPRPAPTPQPSPAPQPRFPAPSDRTGGRRGGERIGGWGGAVQVHSPPTNPMPPPTNPMPSNLIVPLTPTPAAGGHITGARPEPRP